MNRCEFEAQKLKETSSGCPEMELLIKLFLTQINPIQTSKVRGVATHDTLERTTSDAKADLHQN